MSAVEPLPPARVQLITASLTLAVVVTASVWAALYIVAVTSYVGPTSVPACSWPLRVRGPANQEQAGLIRCYLRALARQDATELRTIAWQAPRPAVVRAQFADAAAARSGRATALFVPNPDDDAYLTVDITFSDGVRDSVPMLLANPASAHSWRLQLGD